MEKLKNIPFLRFPEFNGNWNNRKIKEILSIGSGKDYKHLDLGDVPVFGTGGLMTMVNSYLHDGETVCIGRKGTIDKPMYFNGKIWTVDTLFYTHSFRESNPKFVFNLFQRVNWKQHNEAGGVPSLSKSTIEEISLNLPSLKEQTKIATFLTAVDDKLQALKQKKSLLEQYKKGVMQKIFSQELRFKDDNGNDYPDWEEKKLGEVFYSEKGKGISKNKVNPDGNFECVLYGELYTRYNEVIYNVVSKTNEVDGIKSKKGDLLIPSSTTTSGIDLANVTALNKDDVLLGGDITVLRSNTEINNVFYAYYLSNYKKEEIASYAQGSTIVHLYYSHIKDMEIHILSFYEQTKIANFLSAIDDKINHCQSQIEKMEVWKKGLLQQMFV